MNKNQDIQTSIGHLLTGLKTLERCLDQGAATDQDLDMISTICGLETKHEGLRLKRLAMLQEGPLTTEGNKILGYFRICFMNILFRLRQERDHGAENYQKRFIACGTLAQLKLWWKSLDAQQRKLGMRAMKDWLGKDPKEILRQATTEEQIDLLAVAMYAVEVSVEKAEALDKQWKGLDDYDRAKGLEIIEDLVKQDPLAWWRDAPLSERIRVLEQTLQVLEQIRAWSKPENPTERVRAGLSLPRASTCAA